MKNLVLNSSIFGRDGRKGLLFDVDMPEQVGPYRILEKIGAGGLGSVYRALQDSPHREVALKVIQPHVLSASALRRFDREVALLGRLGHEGIARIFESGTFEGPSGTQPFFSMELVEGHTLDDFVRHENPTIRERLNLFLRICDAVNLIHREGVLHRDLKPRNIMVTTDGATKVMDFGLAKTINPEARSENITRSGNGGLLGTLAYMSPEQVGGEKNEIDVRSDVYSLGVILYQLLACELPYDLRKRNLPEAVRLIENAQSRRLGSVSKEFRGDLETIVSHALEKHRERRYQTVAELALDLRRFLSRKPIFARPASSFRRVTLFLSRNALLLGALSVVIGALTIGSLITTTGWKESVRSEKQVREQYHRLLDTCLFLVKQHQLLGDIPGAGDVRTRTLDELAASLEELASQTPDNPKVKEALSEAQEYFTRLKRDSGIKRPRDAR